MARRPHAVPAPASALHGAGMGGLARSMGIQASGKVDFFAASGPPLQGYGALAKEPLAVGEALLEIPLAACLVPLVLPDAPAFVDEQQKLMLRLLQEVFSPTRSQWAPYLDTLPREFPTVPLWYSAEELRLLRGTSVDALLAGRHIAAEQDLLGILDWAAHREPRLFPTGAGVGLPELRWAASVVASRAFDSVKAGVVLAPFADALNHRGCGPHTRMRDGGDVLRFCVEDDISAGEEVFNTYGAHGNTQWLLNGGFLDLSGPFHDLLVTPADAVSAALAHLRSAAHGDEDDVEDRICERLSVLQRPELLGTETFQLTSEDPLPDELATVLMVLCMDDDQLEEYLERAADRPLIDLVVEEPSEALLHGLYSSVLRLVDLLEGRYDTPLEEDLAALAALERPGTPEVAERAAEEEQELPEAAAPKRPRTAPPLPRATAAGAPPPAGLPDGVRAENLRAALLLRAGQKQLLRDLRGRTQECFADA